MRVLVAVLAMVAISGCSVVPVNQSVRQAPVRPSAAPQPVQQGVPVQSKAASVESDVGYLREVHAHVLNNAEWTVYTLGCVQDVEYPDGTLGKRVEGPRRCSSEFMVQAMAKEIPEHMEKRHVRVKIQAPGAGGSGVMRDYWHVVLRVKVGQQFVYLDPRVDKPGQVYGQASFDRFYGKPG